MRTTDNVSRLSPAVAVPRAETARDLLRHAVATVAYRGAKALRGAPDKYASFKVSKGSRTPAQILAHIGDLYDWALALAQRQHEWHDSPPLPWDAEVERFFKTLKRFDDYLASDSPLKVSAERLFQGPVADSLTHVGQLTMLRRLVESPVKGENYLKSEIFIGVVGPNQAPPRVEFD
jgi:hypothetical protein